MAKSLDWTKARPARFPDLKPSTRAISLRLPAWLLERIKIEANKRDVTYQSLIKIWLAEKLEHGSARVTMSPAAKRFIGSDKSDDRNVSNDSKRLVREHFRGK